LELPNASKLNFIYTSIDDKGSFIETGVIEINKNHEYRIKANDIPKPYVFRRKTPINNDYGVFSLIPPNGNNLIEIIQSFSDLRQEIGMMFSRYGQKLQLRIDERKLEIIKEHDGITYAYPYSSVADTLQRIIFYLAAIESNDDAVLLFEEPEAHSFPVYVSKLGRRIVESQNNQFFIDTHSPYLITEILEEMLTDNTQASELAIFAAYYEDHQTKVHQLSAEEIRSIRADGIDVFYNMKRFTTGAAHNA
jgi:AAA15 family ATPase/GTPase